MSKAHDSAIIEAAARALMTASEFGHRGDAKKFARVVLTVVTPRIEAAALERAAKVAEETTLLYPDPIVSLQIAAAIRALKQEAGD